MNQVVKEFYVSDAFGAFTVPGGHSWSYPGVVNVDGAIPSNTDFLIRILSCSLNILPLSEQLDGFNADLCMTMVDVTDPERPRVQTNPNTPDQVSWPAVIRFNSPYGDAPNGIIMNQSLNGKLVNRSHRNFGSKPLILGGHTPSNSLEFIPAAAFKLHSWATRLVQYDYHIHGEIIYMSVAYE